MSASREKKNRQTLSESGYVDPRKAHEAEGKAKDRRQTRIYTLIIAAFLLIGVGLFASNRIQAIKANAERAAIGQTAAVRIGGKEYSVNEVAYYYSSVYNTIASSASSFGYDTSSDPRDQQFTDDRTWFDYFIDVALQSMTQSVTLADKAEAEGFDASTEADNAVESGLASVDTYASYYGTTRAKYLQAAFGEYMTEDVFKQCVRRDAIASAYQQSYADSLTYTDTDLQAAYDANPSAYQSADIEYVLFNTTLDSDATDEDKAAAQAENKTKAESLLARYAQGENFEALAEELDGSYTHLSNASSTSSDLLQWAFDDARVSGDTTTIVYNQTGYYAALFHDRTRNDYYPVSVRHILVSDEDKANELLTEYLGGEQTEDAFAALAQTNSTDSSASNGGLYENIYKGQMVAAFEDWCFDPVRQPGDTGIVQTSYGYHVMYFVGTGDEPYWKVKAASDLKSSDTQSWLTEQLDGVDSEQLDGMQYVG